MSIYQPAPLEIVTALLDYGVPVVEHGSWQTRGTQYDASFYGSMNHHDALTESVSDARALQIMVDGRPPPNELKGPLTNGWGDSDGVYYLIAYGNANHAGWGEADVLDRTKAGLAPLGDARLDADKDSVVGNTWYWGSEWRNAGDGRDPYEQLDTMIRVNAALVDVFAWPNADVCVGHREWTARKIDPAGFDMTEFRRLIDLAWRNHVPQEDDDMAKPPQIFTVEGPSGSHVYIVPDGGVEAHHLSGDADIDRWKSWEAIDNRHVVIPATMLHILDGPLKTG